MSAIDDLHLLRLPVVRGGAIHVLVDEVAP